ncbi:MAG TPA: tetratricopeptide repeat protein, partial [Candidatus Dormibacteraeota bacterium]|nr:tetratricopeptide repeat protein [Candidatus Dormibacteraeota bacterium]
MKLQNYFSTRARVAANLATIISVLGLAAAAPAADTTSPSDILEKAVYSEQTKGDLDAALQLYQQVIDQGKDAHAVAAQAQYRLGVCYYKKKDYTRATEAFEKVVKDYSDQKDLAAKAQEYLSGAAPLLPAPWGDDEDLLFDVKFPTGFKLGMATYAVHAGETNGQKIWRLSTQIFAGVQQVSQVEVVADSFKPLHCRWKHTLIGDSDTTYSPGHAVVVLKGSDKPKEIDTEGVIYDNEEAVQLFRRLPLETNYSTTIRVLTGLGGGSTIPIKIEVPSIDKVETPAGSFDAYRVELNIKQTFWISTDSHRYVVKFEAGGVVAELTQITQRKIDEPAVFRDSASGLSASAPGGWYFDKHQADETSGETRVFVLDPDAISATVIAVQGREALKPEAKKSLRAWSDYLLQDAGKSMKDVKPRGDGWKETTFAGQPALSMVADFTEG